MKLRITTFLFGAMLCTSVYAQTQQGYVKTLGRPNQKGVALSGVSVRVKGGHNAVLSNTQGIFSMSMTGKKSGDAYALQQVQKSGYELKEQGVIGRQYAFSEKAPLTIVMVSSKQLQTDKQRIENNAYQQVEKNYKSKLAQLEKQKTSNTITIEQYRQQLQDLQDKFEKYQSLIDDLAEHYARTDYDELDEKEREINLCIEDGNLNKAEALLLSLGIEQRLAGINQRIKTGQRLLDEANEEMARVLKQQEKDAEYLYQLYTIALAKFDNEKARFYIVTRAELDSTNIKWQQEAIDYLCEYLSDYKSAQHYAERALTVSIAKDGHESLSVADCLNKKGMICYYQGKYDKSLKFEEQALILYQQLSETPTKGMMECYVNLGNAYFVKSEVSNNAAHFKQEEEYRIHMVENYINALNVCTKIENLDHDSRGSCIYCIAFAFLTNARRSIIRSEEKTLIKESLEEASKWFDLAIKEWGEDLQINAGKIATCYMTMSMIPQLQGDLDGAREYLNKAMNLLINIYGEQHPHVATCLFSIGSNYGDLGNREKATEFYRRSYEMRKVVLGESHYETQNARKQMEWSKHESTDEEKTELRQFTNSLKELAK